MAPPRSKRQRREEPHSLLDNESLACVASYNGTIHTPVVDNVTKEIVLDRLDKEICKRFSLTVSVPRAKRQMVMRDGKMVPAEKKRRKREMDPSTSLVRSRIKLGTNECTRVLEAAVGGTGPKPLLIILAKNIHPPNILAHIPHLSMKVGTPVMLLPGKASEEMGKTLGVAKRVAILVFLPRPSSLNDDHDDAAREADHARIDSFIDFIKTKIPKQDTKLAT